MVYKDWDEIIEKVKTMRRIPRAAIAAAEDAHTLEAVFKAKNDGLINPVLVGNASEIKNLLLEMGETVNERNIYDVKNNQEAAKKAVELITKDEADFLMKGMLDTAVLLKEVVNKENGLGKGRLMSHVAIQKVPAYHKMLITTDGGMNLYPNLEQKQEIIENAVELLLWLGYKNPKVGVLAGVEKINPKMKETVEAGLLKELYLKGTIRDCIIEGPISLDLALVKERSILKGYSSQVAGDVDILVCPDMASGNILGKSLVEMAGAKMAGLIMGAKVPVIVTSRGSSAEEKYLSLVLAAASTGRR